MSQKTSAGGKASVDSSRNIVPFLIFHLKICLMGINISINW